MSNLIKYAVSSNYGRNLLQTEWYAPTRTETGTRRKGKHNKLVGIQAKQANIEDGFMRVAAESRAKENARHDNKDRYAKRNRS